MTLSARLFGPGVRLMRSLRIPVKMSVMGLFLLVPLGLLLAMTLRTGLADMAGIRSEIEGAKVVQRIDALVKAAQTHRGLTSRHQAHDATATAALPKAREAFATAHQQLAAQLALPSQFETADLWHTRSAALATLAAGRHSSNRNEGFAQHTQAIESLRQLQLLVAERSTLLLDPQATTFFLMDMAIERTLPVAELMARTRGELAAVLARGDISNTERVQLLGRMDSLGQQLDDLQGKMDALQRSGMAAPSSWQPALAASNGFATQVRALLTAEVLDGDPKSFFANGTAAIAAFTAFNNAVLDTLETALEQRYAAARAQLWWSMAVAALGISLVLYFAVSFYLSFRGAFGALIQGVDAVANGNLEHRVVIHGNDELAEVGRTLEGMNGRLSAMVAEIRSNAVRVGQSGQAVAVSTESLAQRTDEQAASLRQTVATVAQMRSAVAATASAAQQLDSMASDLRLRAEAGGSAMQATVGAMATLQSSANRVAEIIGVIDGIAFQTNILALNAAVEAARAGEAGRGFAVVASEVRMLAQRSSTAAAEIRQLIGQSSEQVQASAGRIAHVNATLGAVVVGVQEVSVRLRGIAQATAEQNVALAEMGNNVTNLDTITRHNAGMVEASTQASHDLVVRADTLSLAVASIRLRQGGADEARALVQRALQLISAHGLQSALQHMRGAGAGFVDRDMYVFIADREGRYRLHAAKPAMEGKRVHDVPGINGDQFVRDVWGHTKTGPAWVEYDILNLDTGTVQPKVSYVARIDERLVLGCGVYRAVAAAASAGVDDAAAKGAATGARAPAGFLSRTK